jgi:hypothetical protein
MSQITFALEFRKKMGQDHLWAGNLETGSLSDKQKEILKEKKRVTNEKEARLLGTGFFKFAGIDKAAYSAEEADFWKIPASEQPSASRRSSRTSPPSISVLDKVPTELLDYYRKFISPDPARLRNSIARDGVTDWIAAYRERMEEDPDGKSVGQGTLRGE